MFTCSTVSLFLHLICDLLAIIGYVAKVLNPFGDDFVASRFNDTYNVSQYMLWHMGIIIAYQAIAGLCNPYLRCVFRWFPFRNMHVDRLERFVLVCPEIDPVRSDLKDLRHFQTPLAVKTV